MPNYVAKKLAEYGYKSSKHQQYCPYEPNPIRYGKNLYNIVHEEESPPLNDNDKKFVQQVIGSFSYYARAIDLTILHALSAIASEQSKPTKRTMKRAQQLPDYLNTNPNAVIRFRSPDMILNVHSDASYLSAGSGCSRAGGYFFMGSLPRDREPIQLNGNIAVTCVILKLVAYSAAEAELGELFLNTKEARIIQLKIAKLSHPSHKLQST